MIIGGKILDMSRRSRITSLLPNLLALLGILLIVLPCAAQEQLSGAQSGILPGGLYDVIDDISVEQMTDWTLEPGVQLRFQSGTELQVRGILVAEGMESDSIRFIRYAEDEPWAGIEIYGWGYARFEYSVITGSNQTAVYGHNNGKFYLNRSRVSNCSSTQDDYAGIHSESALVDTIWNSVFSENDGYSYYGLLNQLNMRNCQLINNNASAVAVEWGGGGISNCIFQGNQESSILSLGASLEIDTCSFTNNHALDGGAIKLIGFGTIIRRSEFVSNQATNNGGAIWEAEELTLLQIHHSVFSENIASGHGSAVFSDDGLIVHSIFIDHSISEVVYCNDNGIPMRNNLFYNNLLDYASEVPDPTPIYGVLDTVNVNGDSCDANFNLYLDPLFLPDSSPPWQVSSESPAIDAGTDLWGGVDPDSTLPDIGIHYFDQTASVAEQMQKSVPRTFSIFNAYPNPFNSSITIDFALAAPSVVDYAIYTVSGREVDAGTWGWVTGAQTRSWRAPRTLSSGVYLVRFSGNGQTSARRITYLK
jgi:Right handed beta helix region